MIINKTVITASDVPVTNEFSADVKHFVMSLGLPSISLDDLYVIARDAGERRLAEVACYVPFYTSAERMEMAFESGNEWAAKVGYCCEFNMEPAHRVSMILAGDPVWFGSASVDVRDLTIRDRIVLARKSSDSSYWMGILAKTTGRTIDELFTMCNGD